MYMNMIIVTLLRYILYNSLDENLKVPFCGPFPDETECIL